MLTLSLVQNIAVWAIPVLLAITLHEVAHAYVAYRCGDTTAKMLGRLSVNPFHHISLVGTVLVPIMIGVLSQFHFIFGWAKPVPINWSQLRNPRRDMALVGAAGPLANFVMAFLWAACLKIGSMLHPETSVVALFAVLTGQAGMVINLVLAFLNLIPIPPLDGSRIVTSLLPPRKAIGYERLEPYGFFILLFLLFTGLLNTLLGPLLNWFIQFLFSLFHV